MKFDLFSRVKLEVDFPYYRLVKGDIGTVVDYHPVSNGENGYSLEVFNIVGDTIAVLAVAESQIKQLETNETLKVISQKECTFKS